MNILNRFKTWFFSQKLVGKILVIIVGLIMVCCLCSIPVAIFNPSSSTPEVITTAVSSQLENMNDKESLEEISEPTKTEEIKPTNTTRPSNTPKPTNTPRPTNTSLPPTSTPEPITLTGNGDSIVDFDNYYEVAILKISGNSSAHHFAVLNYDADGENIDLLVNTTEPYNGIVPLDFNSGEHTARFEVKATGDWKIEILPLSFARELNVPGIIEGSGDEVILLTGKTPDLAKIVGNSVSNHFAVIGYGDYSDLLVNTTDPYDGTVMIGNGTIVLEIIAVGNWSIDITSK